MWVSFYRQGDRVDLCRGSHAVDRPHPGIQAPVILGAYWRATTSAESTTMGRPGYPEELDKYV
jgi:threonyl-tRNA synthetase